MNLRKTKIMVFGSNKRSKICDFKLGSDIIESTDTYCYLGITIDKNGNFTTALDELRKSHYVHFMV